MRYIDISVLLGPDLPAYPGEDPPRRWLHSAIASGADFNVTALQMMVHSGTHIDAPIHVREGAAGTDSFSLEAMNGPAYVVDARSVSGHIDPVALSKLDIPRDATRLLFRTQNSKLWASSNFAEDFVAATADAAEELVQRGVTLVGIDYLSIAPASDPLPTHQVLIEAGVVILEGLNLGGVEPGAYGLVCLPLLLSGCDGAPCRAVLVADED